MHWTSVDSKNEIAKTKIYAKYKTNKSINKKKKRKRFINWDLGTFEEIDSKDKFKIKLRKKQLKISREEFLSQSMWTPIQQTFPIINEIVGKTSKRGERKRTK